MRLLTLLAFSIASICSAATATVTGTINNANGTGFNGYIYLSWPAFTNAASQFIAAGEKFPVKITSGVLSVALETSVGRSFVYSVQYQLRYGKTITEWWSVPASGPVDVSVVRTNVYLYPNSTIAVSQLGQGGATAGQSLVWVTATGWTPGVQGVSCPVVATASFTCAHNLNSTSVIVEAKDASGNTEIPARVQLNGLNSVILLFDTPFTGTIIVK